MYNHIDEENQEIKSDYPEHDAVFNLEKNELTAFYNGNIDEVWQGIGSLEQAEEIFDKYISDLEESGAV